MSSKAEQILAGLGGAENIVEIEACITRLRTEVKDGSLVDQAALKAAGAHGVMAAGTLAHLRRRDLDSWILAVILLAKLSYEQIAGSMPFAGDASTVVDAHLYGAIGGLSLALFLSSRREPQ